MELRASFYWGGGPLSYLQYLSLASFKHFNPNWEIILYMPKIQSTISATWDTGEQKDKFNGPDYLGEAKKIATVVEFDFNILNIKKSLHEVCKSDIVRWWLLYEYGGLWSDIDILYTKPIDMSIMKYHDTALVFHGTPYIGFFMTKAGVKLFKDLYELAVERTTQNPNFNYQAFGAVLIFKNWESFESLQESYSDKF